MVLWHFLESEPDNNFWKIGVNTVKALKAKIERDNNNKKTLSSRSKFTSCLRKEIKYLLVFGHCFTDLL